LGYRIVSNFGDHSPTCSAVHEQRAFKLPPLYFIA